jgi:hypothetical protein
MQIEGRCHCGNIAFTLAWTPAPTEIPARACDCTFCRKHGGVWTAHPGAALRIRVGDPSLLSRYEFGTMTAQFHICTRCGVVPVATSEIDGRLYAVVNVHSFENVPPALLNYNPASFDGEDTTTRLARRKQRWIGDVSFVRTHEPSPPVT